MAKERLTVGGGKSGEAADDGGLKLAEGTSGGLPQVGLELGEGHFDRIEIGAISGQISDGGTLGRNQLGHAGDLVRGEVIEDDDVALFELWAEDFAEVSGEDLGIDRAFDEEGCGQPVAPERSNEGGRFPMALGYGGHAALAPERAPIKPRHLGVEARLVDKHQPGAVPLRLGFAPPAPCGPHVRPRLLGGVRRFFYNSGPAGRAGATAR